MTGSDLALDLNTGGALLLEKEAEEGGALAFIDREEGKVDDVEEEGVVEEENSCFTGTKGATEEEEDEEGGT